MNTRTRKLTQNEKLVFQKEILSKGEFEHFKHLITKTYPSGIISIVSDTFNIWTVCIDYIPRLKDIILNRNGKVVLRPDSGTPELILCGDPNGNTDAERKGVVQLLWEVFGGTYTDKGYKLLDEHIGVIYGDGINLKTADNIYSNLMTKGFASQVLFGSGSFQYVYNKSRDSLGLAMKATYLELDNGKCFDIYKDPVTDSGLKKSAKGLLRVDKIDGKYTLADQVSWAEEKKGELKTVFKDGKLLVDQSLSEIRARLQS